MKTMKWLLKREFWEHKGAFFWAPIVAAGVMFIFLLVTLGLGTTLSHFDFSYSENGDAKQSVSSAVHTFGPLADKFAQGIGDSYMLFGAPLFAILGFVVFFYCLNSLYDERRDRSILFWKSLPISDRDTVLSKLITALVLTPIIFIVIAFALSFAALLMTCVAFSIKGMNVFGVVLSSPELYLSPIKLAAMLPIHALWALPTVGWLLMVSAWARSKVFLWAVGVPVLSIVLVWWSNGILGFGWNANWYARTIVGRLLLSVFPGGWSSAAAHEAGGAMQMGDEHSVGMSHLFRESISLLQGPNLWLGAIAGVAMIVAAIYLRRWRED